MSEFATRGVKIGALVGGLLGAVTVFYLIIGCSFSVYSDSFCTFYSSGDAVGVIVAGGICGAVIGAICVWGVITLVEKQRDSQRDQD